MLIGLNGFLGSGKDTVYQRIAELELPDDLRGYQVVRISFADKLKLSAAAALGVFPSQNTGRPTNTEILAWTNLLKDHGTIKVSWPDVPEDYRITGREYLQYYGTESHRDFFGTNFWVDQALPEDYWHAGRVVCVTDARFPNEIARIKQLGGQIWHIAGIDDSSSGTHASEIRIDDALVDVHISNNVRDDDYLYLDGQIQRALSKRYILSER